MIHDLVCDCYIARFFSKLVLDAPKITANALQIIKSFCDDEVSFCLFCEIFIQLCLLCVCIHVCVLCVHVYTCVCVFACVCSSVCIFVCAYMYISASIWNVMFNSCVCIDRTEHSWGSPHCGIPYKRGWKTLSSVYILYSKLQ